MIFIFKANINLKVQTHYWFLVSDFTCRLAPFLKTIMQVVRVFKILTKISDPKGQVLQEYDKQRGEKKMALDTWMFVVLKGKKTFSFYATCWTSMIALLHLPLSRTNHPNVFSNWMRPPNQIKTLTNLTALINRTARATIFTNNLNKFPKKNWVVW